MADIGA